ncbi:MAG: D-2-hydroxyacid dehydrogenase [Thermomicrobiales bacterium]
MRERSNHDVERTPLRKIVILIPNAEPMRERLLDAFPQIDVAIGNPKVPADIADADMVIAWWLSEDGLAAAKRLRWLHVGAAGVEQILEVPGFRERSLILTNSSGISAPNMAEHAIALMLGFARKFPSLYRSQAERHWQDWDAGHNTFEIGGQTVVLVGLGAIGQAIAVRARALGMHVVGVRRTADGATPDGVDEVVALADLDSALGRADHVINSLPDTLQTSRMFDAQRFAAMKPGAYIYNLGRGTTIDHEAMIAALESGHLAGAGLDVTDPEPLNEDSVLWGMPNVFITAHTSGNSPMVRERLIDLCVEQVRRYVAGEALLNVVDQAEGY